MLARYSKSKLKNEQRTEKKQQNTLRLYRLSYDLVTYLNKVLKNGLDSVKIISFERMNQLCELQLQKITQFKGQDGQNNDQVLDHELTVAVVGIQSKIILEEKRQADFVSSRLSLPDRKSESEETRDLKLLKRYENLLAEIQKSESQIRIFLDRETNQNQLDFANCYFFFVTHARKLKKLSKEKLISSRIKLLQTLIYFLKEAAVKLQPEMSQKIEAEYKQQSIIYGANASFLDSPGSQKQHPHESLNYEQVNNWTRYSSRFLQDKIIQLSGICEQIPQLQTYKRTLQFAQLQSNQKVSFFKVVDVLISLHHKVSYLARNKPQLLKELEQAKCQITFMNTRIDEFLAQMMDQANEIHPLNFQGLDQRWKSQLSQDLIHLRGHLHKLSEIIIRQDQIHTQNYTKVERLIKIIQLFSKVLSGEQDFAQQWDQLVNEQRKESESMSNEQYRVIMLLEQCLEMQQSRIEAFQQNENNQVNRTNEQLEIEVNKLIEDYQRLKGDNSQLANTLEMERRLRQELLVEVDQRDKIIKNLSAKKLALQKKLAKQDGESVASSRVKDVQYRKLQHEVQKYLESSLLLKQQLKVSQSQREKLLLQLETEKQQYLKAFQSVNRLKPQRDRLEIECEQLNSRLQTLKNEQLRQTNRLNKTITDLNNEKSLLEMQLDTAEKNNLRLIQRLDLNDKKIAEYNKLMMARLDEKDDNTIPRLEREVEKYKKQLENYQREAREWQLQNKGLRDELSNLKFRLKESQLNRQDRSQSDLILEEFKNKVQKLQNKNNNLSRSLEESKSRQQDLEQKLRASAKRIRELQNKQRELQNDKARLTKNSQDSDRRSQDLQRQLDDLRHWNDKQIRNAREMLSKKQIELLQKVTSMSALQLKIRMLEEQLSQKSSQSDKVTQELIETKVKQYQTTIQTHKLIEIKLEEKARTLQKELQEKIEVEFKLTSEIDRLSKEIDRMKAELEKYLRELSEKEIIIKIERQKIDEQAKQIREYEIKEKVRQQQMNTPHHDKPSREDENTSTPTQFEDPMSRSNLRYDNYFNAKEYDRLSKQYNDFKKHASQKIEALQGSLQDALKEKAKLKAQLSMSITREKEPSPKTEKGKQKLEELGLSLKLQIEKSGRLQQRINSLTSQNQNLNAEVQKLYQKVTQQTGSLQVLRKQKKETNDRLSQQLLEKEKLKLSNNRQTQLLQKIKNLEAQLKEAEELNKNLKNSYSKLEKEMEKETKNMFNHYESQMKRVIAETDSTNSRLSAEVDFLKKQLQIQQNPVKLEKEKEQTFNELKRSIELLLSEKSKLLAQNSRLQNDKNNSDRLRIQSHQELMTLRQKINSQAFLIKTLEQKSKASLDSEENRRKTDDLTLQLNNLIRQRDLIRGQHDTMRKHLEEETKRAIYLQSQVSKLKTEVEQEKSTNMQLQVNLRNAQISNDQKGKNVNLDYFYAKIKALEEALQAVGDQLADSKRANETPVSQGTKMVKSQIIASSPQALELQRLTDLQQDWIKKERVYLQELQSMSRQIYTLKQTIKIGKPERPIVTSLPQGGIPTNNTYSQNAIFNQFELIKVQKVLQGKRRWENIRFSQSLSKWGVPSIVCQQIEDLRSLFVNTSQIIGAINQQQINLQQLVSSLPSLENLIQFIFRILTFFSEVQLNSPQAAKIRSELDNIAKKFAGGYFFTVLEQYTIHILQNNAIEQYKRQLRAKAKELLEIKQKLDDLITQQLEHEERIYNRPRPTAGRSLEPGHYHSSSYSSLSNSRNK